MAKIMRPYPNIIDNAKMAERSKGEQKGLGQRVSEFSDKLFSDENNQRVADYSEAIADLASPFVEGLVGAYGGNVSSLPSYRGRMARAEKAAEEVERASKAEIEKARQKREEELIRLREQSSNRSFAYQEGLRQEYEKERQEAKNERADFEYNREKKDTAEATMTGRVYDLNKTLFDTQVEIEKENIRTANDSSFEILGMRLNKRGQGLWQDFVKATASENDKIAESNRSRRASGVPERALRKPLPISEQGFASYLEDRLAGDLDELKAGSRNGTLNFSPTSIGKMTQLAKALKSVESGEVPANALVSVLAQIGEQVGEVQQDAVPVPTAQERFNSNAVVIGDDAIVPTKDGWKGIVLGRGEAMRKQGEGTVLMAQAQLDRLEFEKQKAASEVQSQAIQQDEDDRRQSADLLKKLGGENRRRAGMGAWLARNPDVVARTEKALADDKSIGFLELDELSRAELMATQLDRQFLSSTILDLTPRENANTIREKYINGTLEVRKDDYDQMAQDHVVGELEAQWKAEHEGYMTPDEWKATMGEDTPYPFPRMPSTTEFLNSVGGVSGAVNKYHKVYAANQNEQIANSRKAYRQELAGLNIKTLNSNPEVARSAASIPNPFLSMGKGEGINNQQSYAILKMLGLGSLYGGEMNDGELADILYDPANKLLPILTPNLEYKVASSRSAGLSDNPVIRNLFGGRGVVPYNDIPMPAESRGTPPIIDSNLSDAEAASVNQKMTEDSSAEMSAAKANRYAGFPEPLYENQYERMDEIATVLQQTMADMNATGGKANQERASQFKRLQVALARKSGGSADPRLVTPYMMAMSIDPILVQLAQSTQKNLMGMDMPDGIKDPLTFVMKNTASAIESKAEGRFWGTMPIEQKKMLLADSDKRIIFVPHLANTSGADTFLKPYKMGQAYVDLAGRVLQKKKGEPQEPEREYTPNNMSSSQQPFLLGS